MLAAFCTSKETIDVRETDAPRPGPGEVLVRVREVGICGSDLHFYDGSFPITPTISPGHEIAGEVAELGEGVTSLAVGDRVGVEALRRCGACAYCITGRYHLCRKGMMIGTQETGAMREYVSLPAYTLYKLPDEIDFEVGATAEPLAVAVHGLHLVNVSAGERVLVMGSGTIGLFSVLCARAMGADVVATYRHDHQGEAAMRLGASQIVRDSELGRLDDIDVVVETVGGHAPTLAQALGTVRPGGRVSVLGVFTQMPQMNALMLVLKEITMVGGITYCRPGLHADFDVALDILRNNAEAARSIITHRFPLAEAGKAFATAADKSTKSLKVHVQI